MYILHKINFFPLLQNFLFFSSSFFHQGRGLNEKILPKLLFYSYYPPSHILLVFFHKKGEKKWEKNAFNSLNFYNLHSYPPAPGSTIQNIQPWCIFKISTSSLNLTLNCNKARFTQKLETKLFYCQGSTPLVVTTLIKPLKYGKELDCRLVAFKISLYSMTFKPINISW